MVGGIRYQTLPHPNAIAVIWYCPDGVTLESFHLFYRYSSPPWLSGAAIEKINALGMTCDGVTRIHRAHTSPCCGCGFGAKSYRWGGWCVVCARSPGPPYPTPPHPTPPQPTPPHPTPSHPTPPHPTPPHPTPLTHAPALATTRQNCVVRHSRTIGQHHQRSEGHPWHTNGLKSANDWH